MQPVLPAKCIKLAHQLRAAQLEKPYAARSLWRQAVETLILIVDRLVLLAVILSREHLHVGIVSLVGFELRAELITFAIQVICPTSQQVDRASNLSKLEMRLVVHGRHVAVHRMR